MDARDFAFKTSNASRYDATFGAWLRAAMSLCDYRYIPALFLKRSRNGVSHVLGYGVASNGHFDHYYRTQSKSHASANSKQAIACHAGDICVVVYEASLSRFDVFHVGAGQALSFYTRDTEKRWHCVFSISVITTSRTYAQPWSGRKMAT